RWSKGTPAGSVPPERLSVNSSTIEQCASLAVIWPRNAEYTAIDAQSMPPRRSGPTATYGVLRRDDDLAVLLRVAECLERAGHAVEPDLAGDHRRHIDLPLGDRPQARGELHRVIAQRELDVELFADPEERVDRVALHAYADHHDAGL